MAKRLFGTTGIRGLVNDLLTPEFASKIAAAFGTYIGGEGKRVLIAMDTRTSSEMLKSSAISGLISVGCDVYDSGIAPSPAVQYGTREFFDAGVMITGSHIPPERNGLKFFLSDGTEVYGHIEEKIEEIYFNDGIERASWKDIGNVETFDAVTPYKEMLLKTGVKGNLKVVLDPGHGAHYALMPGVIEKLGHDLITINSQPDGFFPGRGSEPDEKNLKVLMEVVKEENADVGIAFDCDGDRCIFVDDKGRYVMGDISECMITDEVMKESNKKEKFIVTGVTTSSLVDWIVEKNNGKVIRTKVGASDIVAETFKRGALFSFEENGGSIFPEINPCRDGGLTAVYMLKILKKRNQKLSEIISELPRFYQLKDKIECPDELKQELTEKVVEHYKGQDAKEIIDIDGVKVIFEDGSWMLLRPSGTEPIFRVFVESSSEEKAGRLMEDGLETAKVILEGVR